MTRDYLTDEELESEIDTIEFRAAVVCMVVAIAITGFFLNFFIREQNLVAMHIVTEKTICDRGLIGSCKTTHSKRMAPTIINGELVVLRSESSTTSCELGPEGQLSNCKIITETNKRVAR